MSEMYFVNDVDALFEKCFKTDDEREQYMYMGSKGYSHYFKHIISREYATVTHKLTSPD